MKRAAPIWAGWKNEERGFENLDLCGIMRVTCKPADTVSVDSLRMQEILQGHNQEMLKKLWKRERVKRCAIRLKK